jgi:hypothetical protein
MNRKFRLYAAVTLVALFVAGCSGPCSKLDSITAPKAGGGNASFAVYAAMGTSIGAGYESGGLVYRHQVHAYPALFAGQVGAAFTYPAISDSGLPPLLRLVSLVGPVILPGSHPGQPTNLALPTPYTNMSIPGALLFDVADSSQYGRSAIIGIVQRGQGTILQQVVRLRPTFVSIEYGANEVLGPATQGSGTPLFSVPQFGGLLHITLDALQDSLPNAKLALFTVPDVTSIPFVTTIKPYLVNPADGSNIPLLTAVDTEHPAGQLNDDDFVLLTAASLLAGGTGIPVAAGGNGNPLPDQVVLSASEASAIRAAVDGYNTAIRAEADARGEAVVDLHGLLITAASTGFQIGGVRYSSAFITGGLFGLDGVHPTDLAHGLIANTMIDAVNATFGATVPHVTLPAAESYTSSRARPVPPETGTGFPRVEGLDEVLRSLFPRR